eukprot:CAMPEP_0202910930 /NCGR_PEP_ID=MMETSP1392-20130828/53484_1 /ASSEMBLY_ACC=CAM_ASM_000868 /TAXON_ID=225041 /ORGANISM="Chlamydomonas chlamydogama, Strain SAG 11-48b" /LENGTH=505 /DNA_ID=CAMNT_0049601221 /DNA_START=123 /DNA_END=1638 /DNA_ORIENTATION=+
MSSSAYSGLDRVPCNVKKVFQPLSGTVVGLLAIGALVKRILPDQHRSLNVWKRILPIYLKYLSTKYFCDLGRSLHVISEEGIERRWAKRHEAGSKQVYRMIHQVGGYYVKTGQVMATKSEILPAAWCRQLSKLWDDAKPRRWSNVRKSIQADLQQSPLGKTIKGKARSQLWREWFQSIDEAPLASASIAQVHGAVMSPALMNLLGASWAHGPEVVIKVQHHDVQALMGADLRNMSRVARFLQHLLPFSLVDVVLEMQTVIPKEFDFEREARLMATIRGRLQDAGLCCRDQPAAASSTSGSSTGTSAAAPDPRIVIPQPIKELSTDGILVQQRISGTPFKVVLQSCQQALQQLQAAGVDTAAAAGTRGLGTLVHLNQDFLGHQGVEGMEGSSTAHAHAPSSTHSTNSTSSGTAAAAAPRHGAGGGAAGAAGAGSGLGAATGQLMGAMKLLASSRGSLHQLLMAYGHMMLVDGLYHADPHPGNFLIMEDGRIGLLDFGQCCVMSEQE